MQGFMVPASKINTKKILTKEGLLDKNEIMLCKQDAKWGWAERQGVSSYINHYMESFKWYILSFFLYFSQSLWKCHKTYLTSTMYWNLLTWEIQKASLTRRHVQKYRWIQLILSQIYVLFGLLITGLNNAVAYQKWQISGMMIIII